MNPVFEGKMHVFGDNIDTDQIYPGQYLDLTDHGEMARHCLEGAAGTFARDFKPGDIIIAGTNFGCGSSRENAAIALKVRGVSCVVARSFARIFYRNALNLGLPLIVCAGLEGVAAKGQRLQVDLRAGAITNLDTGISSPVEPISDYAMSILDAGGIKALMLTREPSE
ncbi:MAG: 3-isopropylmalate dehydratase small subunit [Christensenellales bacterium]